MCQHRTLVFVLIFALALKSSKKEGLRDDAAKKPGHAGQTGLLVLCTCPPNPLVVILQDDSLFTRMITA